MRVDYVFDGQQRFFQRRAFVGDLSVGEHAARLDGIAETNLPWRDANLARQQIQIALHGEAGLRDAKPAESARRNVVGVNGAAFDIDVVNLIGPRGVRASALQHRAAQRGVRAGIGHQAHAHGSQLTVFVASGGAIDFHGMALGMDAQAFVAAQRELHRPPTMPGQKRRVMLHRHIFLAAKSSADKFTDDAHLFARDAEHAHNLAMIVVDALSCRVDRQRSALCGHG